MSPEVLWARAVEVAGRAATSSPLDPGGDDARRQLRRELVRPEYNRTDPVQRLLDWLGRLIDRSVDAASGAPSAATAVTVLVVLLLIAAAITLAARTRRSARERREVVDAGVLGSTLTAAELRERAERSLTAGDAGSALLDGFRAAATRQVERGRITEAPQATALEVARSLGALSPAHADDALRAGTWFDEVLYGDRPATDAQARAVLDLDTALAAERARAVAP